MEVRERIKDIVSVGPAGAVLQPPSHQPAQPKPPTGLIKPATHPLATVQLLISKIEAQLADVPEDERMPKLVSSLAEAQVEREFELIWGIIFGSQVEALRRLRDAGSVSIEHARKYYEEEVRPRFRETFSDWTFDLWSEFLKKQQLIFRTDDDRLVLTDLGRDFLAFVDLRKQGVEKRPLTAHQWWSDRMRRNRDAFGRMVE